VTDIHLPRVHLDVSGNEMSWVFCCRESFKKLESSEGTYKPG